MLVVFHREIQARMAGRGLLQDDPVKFALRDGVSIACGVLVVAIAALARHAPSWLRIP